MKKIIIVLGLGVLMLSGCTWLGQQKLAQPVNLNVSGNINKPVEAAYQDVTPDKAKYLLNYEDVGVIDVSPNDDFAKGHLPRALTANFSDNSLDNIIPSLDKNRGYLVYSRVEITSILGAQKMLKAGFSKIYRLQGNYNAWVQGNYPLEIYLQTVNGQDKRFQGQATAVRDNLNNQFTVDVKAFLADPPAGKFYQGWLVKKLPKREYLSLGKMTKNEAESLALSYDIYQLLYISPENKNDFNQVIITEETAAKGLDNKPEDPVLIGDF